MAMDSDIAEDLTGLVALVREQRDVVDYLLGEFQFARMADHTVHFLSVACNTDR
jgi:hypothetical protein